MIIRDHVTDEQLAQLDEILREVERVDALRTFPSSLEAIRYAWSASESCRRAAFVDDVLVCVYGVAKQAQVDVPWMFSSDMSSFLSPVSIMRIGRDEVKRIQSGYELLYNYVPAEDEESIELLRSLGFTVASEIVSRDGGLYKAFSHRRAA